MTQSDVRQYEARANSTETFGLVLCSARNHHFVIDGPAQNGCPVEALTPAELFLSGVAACGVELMQSIARDKHLPWQTAGIAITGTIDPENRVHSDFWVFTSVHLQFVLKGINASLWRDHILIPGPGALGGQVSATLRSLVGQNLENRVPVRVAASLLSS
jgi:uncharacterized OsmC-like protein